MAYGKEFDKKKKSKPVGIFASFYCDPFCTSNTVGENT